MIEEQKPVVQQKQSLQEWAWEARQTYSDEVVRAKLKEVGWSDEIIGIAMQPPPAPPAVSILPPLELRLENLRTSATTSVLDIAPRFADIYFPEKTNKITLSDKTCTAVLEMAVPRVVVIDDFMTDEECDQLVEVSRDGITRSTVIERGTGGSTLDDVRTSSGMFHARGAEGIVDTVERRISELIEWPLENGEGMQILRYGPDEKYEPHNDYFDVKDPGSVVNIGQAGQRIASVLIYLNDPESGGSTNFPDVGLEIKPRKGTLLFFAYPTHNAASKTTHGGMPVVRGEKWVAVKWYRINKF